MVYIIGGGGDLDRSSYLYLSEMAASINVFSGPWLSFFGIEPPILSTVCNTLPLTRDIWSSDDFLTHPINTGISRIQNHNLEVYNAIL